jgi:ribonuclease P/MRP protein subunit POP7
MSAVKRIQKLLLQAEKRATANINLEDTRKNEKKTLAELANISSKREEVFVKATGRAIERALNVGKWFEEKETEFSVRVKTGSVIVVDDVVEDEEKKEKEAKKRQRREEEQSNPCASETKSAAKKRKRQAAEDAAVDPDADLPESRTRWVKMVEVAVSLK